MNHPHYKRNEQNKKTRSGRYPESVPNAHGGFAYFRSTIKNNELNFFCTATRRDLRLDASRHIKTDWR
jgi:hypothetical protein